MEIVSERGKKSMSLLDFFKKVEYAVNADGSPDCISACESYSLHWCSSWNMQPQLEGVGVY